MHTTLGALHAGAPFVHPLFDKHRIARLGNLTCAARDKIAQQVLPPLDKAACDLIERLDSRGAEEMDVGVAFQILVR